MKKQEMPPKAAKQSTSRFASRQLEMHKSILPGQATHDKNNCTKEHMERVSLALPYPNSIQSYSRSGINGCGVRFDTSLVRGKKNCTIEHMMISWPS